MDATMLRRGLKKMYSRFFREMGINPETGCLGLDPKRKFATYPYISSKYGEAKKILFVGLDIGKDPVHGCIQSFSDRRVSIEDKSISAHNQHIAGTYMATLYFLKQEKSWNSHWKKITDTNLTCQRVLKESHNLLPLENPLSYCALTNYYKFVTKCRKKRNGSQDRKHLDHDLEIGLFNEELEAFAPDIVIFQGQDFVQEPAVKQDVLGLKRKGVHFFVGPHPSARECNFPGISRPEGYAGYIKPLID